MEKSIETKLGRIVYYADQVNPQSPTVVFLHGLSSNHTTWLEFMAALRAQGYNSLALDLRGHGHSDKTKRKSNYQLVNFTQDLQQIIERENLQKVIIIGYSFGGAIALDYAIRYPDFVAGLILVSTNFVSPWKYKHLSFLLPSVKWLVNFLAWILIWQKRKEYIYFQQGQSRGYWHSVWIGLNTQPLSLNLWMLRLIGTVDFSQTLGQIQAPTLMIRAVSDPFLGEREAQDMQKLIIGSQVVTIQSPSHFLPTHNQAEVSQSILDFVKSL